MDTFQAWLLRVKNYYNKSMKTLSVGNGDKFILGKFKNFYEKKDIIIK